MRHLFLLLAFVISFGFVKAAEAGNMTRVGPDLISVGAGYFDFDRNSPRKAAVSLRAEYRWGFSMLPLISDSFKSWDPYFRVKPFVGIETSSRGQLYALGGFNWEIPMGKHFYLSVNPSVGLYYRGNGKQLGSFVEFRTQAELGYRFENESRVSVFISHVSNAGLTNLNPGANTVGAYYHMPVSWIFTP
jgi:lipid A 3-O-deacylase